MDGTRLVSGKGTPARVEVRLVFLDGLRGLAALTVVLDHYFSLFAPGICGGGVPARGWPAVPLALLTNGSFAVDIFFVLSGFVLSRSAADRKVTLPARLAARYLRLTVPMLASLLFAWLLFHLFPTSRLEVNRILPNSWILSSTFGARIPGFATVLKDGLYHVYWTGKSSLDGAVWTMKSELEGSVLIYLLHRLPSPGQRRAGLMFLAVYGMFFRPAFLAFALGGAWWELRQAGRVGGRWLGWGGVLGGTALSLVSTFRSTRYEAEVFAIGAGLLVPGVFQLSFLRAFLEGRLPRFLGRVSFALYLLHLPLLFTAGAWLYLYWPGPAGVRLFAVGPIFLGGSLLLAWLMTVGLDEPLMKRLHRMKRLRAGPAS